MELGIQAAVFSIFDLGSKSYDLINSEGYMIKKIEIQVKPYCIRLTRGR